MKIKNFDVARTQLDSFTRECKILQAKKEVLLQQYCLITV